jgi:hypothetical protein
MGTLPDQGGVRRATGVGASAGGVEALIRLIAEEAAG